MLYFEYSSVLNRDIYHKVFIYNVDTFSSTKLSIPCVISNKFSDVIKQNESELDNFDF